MPRPQDFVSLSLLCTYPSKTIFISEMVGDPRMMMPPRPGGMHMLGRGGGFPPHGGHPMDYYYNPYMEEYYGGRPPYGNIVSYIQ